MMQIVFVISWPASYPESPGRFSSALMKQGRNDLLGAAESLAPQSTAITPHSYLQQQQAMKENYNLANQSAFLKSGLSSLQYSGSSANLASAAFAHDPLYLCILIT